MPDDALEQLGLAVDDAVRTVALADGVVLSFRPPEGAHAAIVQQRLAEVFRPAEGLIRAAERYALKRPDLGAFGKPENWDGMGRYFAAIELASLVAVSIEREVGGQTVSVEPTHQALTQLLRLADNLERFEKATEKAGSELIQPKKGPAPSLNGCSAAGAPTATDAAASTGPAPEATS